MKFTLGWLKDHLDTTAPLDKISATLTAIGLEVESITDPANALKAFTVAKILQADKHPEADKLRVCKVQSDAGELQIVCGAANARAGIFVALAKEGAVIPGNGMVIKKTKIRGVESNGMLCSAEELALDMAGDGIIELPEFPIGAPVAEALGFNDPVIEIAITPNRADCLGVRGIARDLAAAGLGTLKPLPDTSGVKGSFPSPVSVTISSLACTQFIGCTIKGVKNGESPAWLKARLQSIGQKPISALVDITNYFTITYNRPLHIYDAKKLRGNIVARTAKDEKLAALDGKEYALTPGMGAAIIADDSGAIALGGIIGGAATGCDEHTTDAFLEVALFNPIEVAKTGRALQIDTDARYRFERSVDAGFIEEGAKLALKMIVELCGGQCSERTVATTLPDIKKPAQITLRHDRIASLGGISIDSNECIRILTALGFSVTHQPTSNAYLVTAPTWRTDVEGEADLVEEILRIHGYDNIPTTPLPKLAGISKPTLGIMEKRAHLARRLLASRGFLEACTWSFLPEKQAKLFGGGNDALKLMNPISADLDTMRPSLLPNLLESAKKNAFRGFSDTSLCEIGLQFHDITPEGQRMVAAGLRSGNATRLRHTQGLMTQDIQPSSAFTSKADALALLQSLGVSKCEVTAGSAPAWYHPGRSGALTQGKTVLGVFGEIHPAILQAYDIDTRAAAFEIFLDAIPQPRSKGKAKPALKLSDFQAVERDFAFLLDDKISAAQLLKTLSQANKELITDIALFDVYTGKGVDAGKKSVAVKITLQAADRTLSEADIAGVSQSVVAAATTLGGQLRQ